MLQVAAAVIERDGRILLARRKAGDRFGGLWEFPGGKIEPGEDAREALRREIREELELDVEIGSALGDFPHPAPPLPIVLKAFRASILSPAAPVLREHSEIAWVRPDEASGFALSEPDKPLAALLAREARLG